MDDEELAMQRSRALNIANCRQLGVSEEFLQQWQEGILLEGHEGAPRFHMHDYKSVTACFDRATEEVDRLTAAGKNGGSQTGRYQRTSAHVHPRCSSKTPG